MKLLRLLPVAAILFAVEVRAQLPSTVTEYMDINNFKTAHQVHGDMWQNPGTGAAACEYPKGSGKNVSRLGSLWLSGHDIEGNLKVAAQGHRQTGTDFYPGPVDTLNPLSVTETLKWAKIWKVNRTTIDSFRNLSSHTIANTPAHILTWPGKGNIYARGNNDSALVINKTMAPFIDVDQDGVYNPLSGDYPSIKGDQMFWWIINDYNHAHTNTSSFSLGVEICHSVYAYKRNNKADDMVFYEFLIRNAGPNRFTNFRFGFNNDADLGFALDDYIGFDSARRMGYVYNAVDPDGNGEPTSYGNTIPAAGITFLQLPGDDYPKLTATGSFNYYNSTTGQLGTPTNFQEYFQLMVCMNRAGGIMHNDMAAGSQSTAYGPGPLVRYAFPGNPSNTSEWSQCGNGLPHNADLRYVLVSDTFSLPRGREEKIALALVASPAAGACPTVSLAGLQATADTAMSIYWHPLAPLGIRNSTPVSRSLAIYPNPAKNVLHVKPVNNLTGQIIIYDAIGRTMPVSKSVSNGLIDIKTELLPPGVYSILYRDGAKTYSNVFLKE